MTEMVIEKRVTSIIVETYAVARLKQRSTDDVPPELLADLSCSKGLFLLPARLLSSVEGRQPSFYCNCRGLAASCSSFFFFKENLSSSCSLLLPL